MKGQFFLDFLVHKERSSWLVYHDRYFLQWESHAPLRKISLGSCSHSASCWVRLDYIGQIESSQVPEVHQGTFVFLSRRMRILVGCAIFFFCFLSVHSNVLMLHFCITKVMLPGYGLSVLKRYRFFTLFVVLMQSH